MTHPLSDIALIWAEANGGVIGADGTMPWRLPEDLRHFRELTGTSPVIMGRRTWESLPERFRPLPGRRNIVVTRQHEWNPSGALVAHSLDEALQLARQVGRESSDSELVWIMGGGELYRQSLPLAARAEVTQIDLSVVGDTLAPVLDDSWSPEAQPWQLSTTGLRYRFVAYSKKSPREG